MSMYNIYVEGSYDDMLKRKRERDAEMDKLQRKCDEAGKNYRDAIDKVLADTKEGSNKVNDMLKRYHNENSIYVEGQQAEEYKKRKNEELADKHTVINPERSLNYYFGRTGQVHSDENPNATVKGKLKDAKRAVKVNDIIAKQTYNDMKNGNYRYADEYRAAGDALNKHMRRHPDAYKEQGIFAECVLI